MIKADISHIDEQWVRDNIDINERRSTIQRILYSCDLCDLFTFSEKNITLDEFIEKINNRVDEFIEKVDNKNHDISVRIKHEYGYDDPVLILLVIETYPESDDIVIRRIIQSEKQKIRRQATAERNKEKTREKELAEYRRLRKKYGNKEI